MKPTKIVILQYSSHSYLHSRSHSSSAGRVLKGLGFERYHCSHMQSKVMCTCSYTDVLMFNDGLGRYSGIDNMSYRNARFCFDNLGSHNTCGGYQLERASRPDFVYSSILDSTCSHLWWHAHRTGWHTFGVWTEDTFC